jgi:hypothetical protein
MTISSSGTLYVTSAADGAIAVYPPTANGSATPTALIQGPATDLGGQNNIAVDSSGNIYVPSNHYSGAMILVFAAGATGNVAPVRTITSPILTTFQGLAFDASGDLYAAENPAPAPGSYPTGASIVEFAPGADGAATPIKTITSPALMEGRGLTADSAGNLYLQATTFPGLSPNSFEFDSVLGFGPNASGSVTPGINLTSTAWDFSGGTLFTGSGIAIK